MRSKGPDPRKRRLIRLTINIIASSVLDLLLLGIFFIGLDIFGSVTLQMHEWKSFMNSLNKVLDWRIVVWNGPSGLVFSCATILAGVSMTPIIVWFASSRKRLMLDYCVSLTFIHLLIITRITGIPLDWQWWILKLGVLVLQLLGTRFIASQLAVPLSAPSLAPLPSTSISHIV